MLLGDTDDGSGVTVYASATLTVADGSSARSVLGGSRLTSTAGGVSSLSAVTSADYELVVNPTIVSGTEASPNVYSYKRFVRASSATAVVSLTSTTSWVVFDHCVFDPSWPSYTNTWNCVSINHTATAKFNHIWFVDCLFKSVYDASGYSLNRMGFECTGRPAPTGADDVYQDIRLIRCTFEPPGSEAVSFDGPEMTSSVLVEDVTILGSGNHPTNYSWGQGFEINGPSGFTVNRLTIYPGRGSGTNLGGRDTLGGNSDWTFTDINILPDYHDLQVTRRDSLSHPVYAHDMHGTTWTGTVERTLVGGSGNFVYLSNCDNNDFTGVDWVGSGTFSQPNSTGNTGLS